MTRWRWNDERSEITRAIVLLKSDSVVCVTKTHCLNICAIHILFYMFKETQHMKRLPGYSILFSNESWPNSSCYRNQNSSGIRTVNFKKCRAITQYLWFYQQYKPNNDCAPILEICEVEVFGMFLFFSSLFFVLFWFFLANWPILRNILKDKCDICFLFVDIICLYKKYVY